MQRNNTFLKFFWILSYDDNFEYNLLSLSLFRYILLLLVKPFPGTNKAIVFPVEPELSQTFDKSASHRPPPSLSLCFILVSFHIFF